MSSFSQIAKNYVKNDKLSVIPVGKNKVPLIPWKEFQTRFPTDEEIDQWFDGNPDAQIGIVTGKISNLTVVDVEHGGDPSFLPQETLIVKTGGGGWHYYYRFADGMQNKARVRPLIDIRSEGGYVVAPPSETDKGPYAVIRAGKPSPFPRYLFPQENVPTAFQGGPTQDYRHVTDGISLGLKEYPGYGEGQRNDQMARYIGHVIRWTHPAEWDTKGWEIVVDANKKNIPPLSLRELETTFKSIRSREYTASTERDWFSKRMQRINEEEKEAEASVVPGEDEILHIAEVADRHQIDITDIRSTGFQQFDNSLLGGMIPGDLVIIAGPTGMGKTLFSQDILASVVRSEKKTPSLFFSYEVLPQFVWQKFQGMGLTREDPVYIPLRHTSGGIDWVEKKIKEGKERFGVKCVCVDHIGFLAPKRGAASKVIDANYSTYLTQVARDLKQIAIREEVIMIVPAHVRKTNDLSLNDIANSAGIGQEADIVFLIERERNRSKEKAQYYTEFTRITLAKNRRTGQTVVGWFSLFNGRFMWNTERNDLDSAFEDIDKEEDVVPKEPAVQGTFRMKA